MLLREDAVLLAFETLQKKSRHDAYRYDPVLWADEVLGIFLWSKQREILESLVLHKKTAVKSCHSVGKGIPLTEKIPTSNGFTTMGDLRVGDLILDVHGEPTEVTYVSEDKFLTNYVVVFDDGTEVQCDADHLWQVQDLNKRKRGVKDWRDHWDNTQTENVEFLRANLRTNAGQYRWRVPVAGAMQGEKNENLPLDPYMLGLFLGDGNRANGYLNGGVTKEFYADLTTDMAVVPDPRNGNVMYRSKWLREVLKGMGLVGKNVVKRIPKEYLWTTSEGQRRQLLAGFMDSDGFVGNSMGIDLTDKDLADDLVLLLNTLGVKVGRREGEAAYYKDGVKTVTGIRQRISFTTPWNPFMNREVPWQEPKTSKFSLRTIREIRKVDSVVTRCITVDNPLSCFLVGESFVPTHNTFISAVAVCWWISTRPMGIVRSTAPTFHQVSQLLWKEIRQLHAAHDLIGEVNQKDEWKTNIGGAVNVAGSGQKPSDHNVHSFHGVHSLDGVLTILDEGCGVPEQLFTAANAISTGRNDRVLTIGNPDDPGTHFGEIFLNESEEFKGIWNLITISAFDSPNFTGEYLPPILAETLINPETVDQWRREWGGVDDPRYLSKVLGEFPAQSQSSMFPQKLIYQAQNTDIPEDDNFPLILGVDIAGGGEDDTVVYGNRGGRVRKVTHWNEGNAVYTANRILEVATEVKAEEIRIDSGGFGKGVIDILLKNPMAKNFRIIRMMGGDASSDPNAYRNKRAENYDNLKLLMGAGQIDLDPTDKKIVDELLGVRILFTERGSIKLEAKDDIRKRGGKSPDNVDAIVYATADLTYLFDQQEAKNEAQDPADYLGHVPDWAMTRW